MRRVLRVGSALLLSALFLPAACRANNAVMGELHLEGKSKVEKSSGVWIDGQYVGYLKELKKLMLLPGKHRIVIRQDGYKDFAEEVTVQPGEQQDVNVAMEKAATGLPLHTTSTIIIAANPSRAAVFVDGLYAGHVGEFRGWGRAMLVSPGAHRISIALPGYESFQMDINPQPDQKLVIKTDLLKSSAPLDPVLLKPAEDNTAGNVGVEPGTMASPTER